MAGRKRYIDKSVYDMAKCRIRHIMDIFDTLVVCFSGGKDSLAVLELVDEVYKEDGINEKVKVIFRDEELIPDDVISFVNEKYKSGRFEFYYFAIPLKSQKFVLGNSEEYVQWDSKRKWLRNPPEYAIRLDDGDTRVFDQYSADTFICSRFKGKIALLTGIRASESILRYRACVNKKNENYINATQDKRIKICKPIYDWEEKDVFLFFYKKNIKYCMIYDMQTLNGDNLRVSTPLHAESAKRIKKLKTLYPMFYQQVVDIFPEVLIQARYWDEFDNNKTNFEYEHSFEGIRKFAEDTIKDKRQLALAKQCISKAEINRKNKSNSEFGGNPLLYVLKKTINGEFKRGIYLPLGDKHVTNAMREFENEKDK